MTALSVSGTGWALNDITLNLSSSPAETPRLTVPCKVTEPERVAEPGLDQDLSAWEPDSWD